jgi:hypothetical protein
MAITEEEFLAQTWRRLDLTEEPHLEVCPLCAAVVSDAYLHSIWHLQESR